jgi:predicted aconitase
LIENAKKELRVVLTDSTKAMTYAKDFMKGVNTPY